MSPLFTFLHGDGGEEEFQNSRPCEGGDPVLGLSSIKAFPVIEKLLLCNWVLDHQRFREKILTESLGSKDFGNWVCGKQMAFAEI